MIGESMTAIANRAGVDQRTIARILEGKTKTVKFDEADRIICALNVHAWREELSHIYYSIDLAYLDREKEYRDYNCQRHGPVRAPVYTRRNGVKAASCQLCTNENKRAQRARQREAVAA